MALMVTPKDLTLGQNFIKNFFKASQYVLKIDGLKGFYKGFSAANIKAGLGCYVYFTILRYVGKQQDLKPY